MKILVATPSTAVSTRGNQVTAERCAAFLLQLGHSVDVIESTDFAAAHTAKAKVLIALHARKSAAMVETFREHHPGRPLIVMLTGTDLYSDVPAGDLYAQRSLEAADRLVVLQPRGPEALPASVSSKVVVIVQSALAPAAVPRPRGDRFEVVVSGHLRPVKDPFRAAWAARLLPVESRLEIVHLGAALTPEIQAEAEREMAENPRYHWHGDVPRQEALILMAKARLLVLSSLMEGGANVVCEALACGVPVVSTRIDGSIGLLGEDYPGYFEVGDTEALARLLRRSETDGAFYEELRERCSERRYLVDPARELAAWGALLEAVG